MCGWEVDRTGLGLCAVEGFGISGIELLCSATGELVKLVRWIMGK
jgi:hypothetical protein